MGTYLVEVGRAHTYTLPPEVVSEPVKLTEARKRIEDWQKFRRKGRHAETQKAQIPTAPGAMAAASQSAIPAQALRNESGVKFRRIWTRPQTRKRRDAMSTKKHPDGSGVHPAGIALAPEQNFGGHEKSVSLSPERPCTHNLAPCIDIGS